MGLCRCQEDIVWSWSLWHRLGNFCCMQPPCAVLSSLRQCRWCALIASCSKASSRLTVQHFLLHREAKGQTYTSRLRSASRQHLAHGIAKEQSHAEGLFTTVGSLHWSHCCVMWLSGRLMLLLWSHGFSVMWHVDSCRGRKLRLEGCTLLCIGSLLKMSLTHFTVRDWSFIQQMEITAEQWKKGSGVLSSFSFSFPTTNWKLHFFWAIKHSLSAQTVLFSPLGQVRGSYLPKIGWFLSFLPQK